MLEILRNNISGHLVNKVSTFIEVDSLERSTYFNVISKNSFANKISLLDLKCSEIL